MNTKRFLSILMILLVTTCLLLTACGSAAPADPAAIAQSFYKAVNEGDIDAAMVFVADDIKCRGGCYLDGKESFRAFIQGGINGNGPTEISDLKVEGDTVTYNWEAYTKEGFLEARGVETLQIKNGKIILMEGQGFQ